MILSKVAKRLLHSYILNTLPNFFEHILFVVSKNTRWGEFPLFYNHTTLEPIMDFSLKTGNFNIEKVSDFYSVMCKISCLKLMLRFMPTFHSSLQNTPKKRCLLSFLSQKILAILIRSNLSVPFCILKAGWSDLSVPVSPYCLTSFWYFALLMLISI